MGNEDTQRLPREIRVAGAARDAARASLRHRLVYLVDGDDVVILQARYHY